MDPDKWHDVITYEGLPENYANWLRVMKMLHGYLNITENVTEDETVKTITIRRSMPRE